MPKILVPIIILLKLFSLTSILILKLKKLSDLGWEKVTGAYEKIPWTLILRIICPFSMYTFIKSKCVPDRNRKIEIISGHDQKCLTFRSSFPGPVFVERKKIPENSKIVLIKWILKIHPKIWRVLFFPMRICTLTYFLFIVPCCLQK